ncbi:probable LRR receptor-like serine/threonine-protein kinase At1g34110 [Neltuma alba]|uniref:probable LRR receptor-like serine/threonine-protein kinase At1g34110 n=1 Tax=Neltuma alba TaxID=207710 RepID=UPI0010A2EBC7|nr:probable LRR receptor-like serine/threonine-protein kinase At1g34110 [Prosopis alba]
MACMLTMLICCPHGGMEMMKIVATRKEFVAAAKQHLDLSNNYFYPSDIPQSIESFTNLRYLNLSCSNFVGSIPNELGKLSKLQYLDLNFNYFDGAIPWQMGNLSKLQYLDMSSNYFDGAIPWQMGNLSKLQYLHLGQNNLVGVIPYQLGNLSMLHTLRLGGYGSNLTVADKNNDEAEWISKLSLLTNLELSYVSDVGNSQVWLHMIGKLVPTLTELRLSGCGISYAHGLSLFASPSNYSSSLVTLDLSDNNLNSSSFQWPFNFSSSLQQLYLRNCSLSSHNLYYLSSHFHFPSLLVLDLSYNKLMSLMMLNFGSNLQELYLANCSLSSNNLIFTSFNPNLTSLVLLDLSLNHLKSSAIFYWISNFTFNLHELELSDNSLSGFIPDGFGNTMKSLEVLDLWYNNLQGEDYKYMRPELFLKSIDLSSNALSGEIPRELVSLLGLVSLNLSRNQLSGEIPINIGNLESLEFLDMSNNKLSGPIPSSLANIDRLSVLDLSNNHLYGKIPIGTQLQSFNASSYEGNLDLCGSPLNKMCLEDNTPPPQEANHDEEEEASLFSQEFYLSMGLGFVVGFWAIVGPLLFNRTWRQVYYRFMNTVTDKVHVMVVVYVVKYLTIRD